MRFYYSVDGQGRLTNARDDGYRGRQMSFFDREFDRLLEAWAAYRDVARDPADIRPLAEARARLDEARWRTGVERELCERTPVRRRDVEVPKFDVDPDVLARYRVRGRSPGSMGG